jgi:hypothetical protein
LQEASLNIGGVGLPRLSKQHIILQFLAENILLRKERFFVANASFVPSVSTAENPSQNSSHTLIIPPKKMKERLTLMNGW